MFCPIYRLSILVLCTIAPSATDYVLGADMINSGILFTLTNTVAAPNEVWHWYQDERLVVDTEHPDGTMRSMSTVSFSQEDNTTALLGPRGPITTFVGWNNRDVGRVTKTAGPDILAAQGQQTAKQPTIAPDPSPPPLCDDLTPSCVADVGHRAAQWQLDHFENTPEYGRYYKYWSKNYREWVWATYLTGLIKFAEQMHDQDMLDEVHRVCVRNGWKLGGRPRHADDWAIGWPYAAVYLHDQRLAMLAPTRERFDRIMTETWDESLEWKNKIETRELAWCDALFMGPPTLARLYTATGDRRYLDFADSLWWKTTDYLYDTKRHLYQRDSSFFEKTEPNGERVFWARGNGWVFAGLTRMLEDLPIDHPNRARYLTLYKQMAEKIRTIQGDAGFWPMGLLDPVRWKKSETSGTAFFVYGLAWGINHGLLDAEVYRPVVDRGWRALVGVTKPNGKLTRTQPIGEHPNDFDPEATMPYGIGGLLLAAAEVHKMTLLEGAPSIRLVGRNDLEVLRLNETIEFDWASITSKLDELTPKNVAVLDELTGELLLTQVMDNDADGKPDQLLIQTHFQAKQAKSFRIYKVDHELPVSTSRVFGRPVPERVDDFAWESDRIAYRTYGPALESANDAGSGIDVWTKSVRYPIIDKWYASEDYHTDHGEGADSYKVGKSRGAGGLGVYADGKLWTSGHYTTARVLANGPIRVLFELDFAPWDTPLGEISETKRISLDRGRNLSRIESVFKFEGKAGALPIAVGLVNRKGGGKAESGDGWVGYWEPRNGEYVHTGIGAILPHNDFKVTAHTQTRTSGVGANAHDETNTHTLVVTEIQIGKPFVYYAGAGWSKSGDFPDATAWFDYLGKMSSRYSNPIRLDHAD